MTFPANPILEAAPYGPQPVLPVVGPQGGPYVVAGPQVVTLLPSAARTATTGLAQQNNYGYRGLYLNFVVTVNPGGAQTLRLRLFGNDAVSGATYTLLDVAATATPGGLFLVYPGVSGAPVEQVSLARNLPLPSQWYGEVAHSGVGAWTYALYGWLLP